MKLHASPSGKLLVPLGEYYDKRGTWLMKSPEHTISAGRTTTCGFGVETRYCSTTSSEGTKNRRLLCHNMLNLELEGTGHIDAAQAELHSCASTTLLYAMQKRKFYSRTQTTAVTQRLRGKKHSDDVR